MPNEPKLWDPSQPLENKEDEEEAQARAKARARVRFLEEEAMKSASKPQRKKGIFND